MKSNLKSKVTEAIAETQDGKTLNDPEDFGTFINARIDHNTTNGIVETEDLASDFRYMISQLQATLRPLDKYNNLMDRANKFH